MKRRTAKVKVTLRGLEMEIVDGEVVKSRAASFEIVASDKETEALLAASLAELLKNNGR